MAFKAKIFDKASGAGKKQLQELKRKQIVHVHILNGYRLHWKKKKGIALKNATNRRNGWRHVELKKINK